MLRRNPCPPGLLQCCNDWGAGKGAKQEFGCQLSSEDLAVGTTCRPKQVQCKLKGVG